MRLHIISRLLLVFGVALLGAYSAPLATSLTETVSTPTDLVQSAPEAVDELQAVVSAQESVRAGKNIIFNAARSYNPNPERPAVYNWDFGDGTFDTGEEVVHVFRQPGIYDVTLNLRVGNETDTVTFPIFAYARAVLLVADDSNKENQLLALAGAARAEGILLAVARGYSTTFTRENSIITALQEKTEALANAELIVLWTKGSGGLSALTQFFHEQIDSFDFSGRRIAVISEGNLADLAQISRSTFATLEPAEIILTRADALRELILRGYTSDTATTLSDQAIPAMIVDSGLAEFNPLWSLSFIVNRLLSQGIPASMLLLILMLPVIATIVAFLKQVVGITTFGVYTPSVITLSFLILGIWLGIAILFVVIIASTIMRRLLRHYRLSYTPRMALVLTGVALAILFTVAALTELTNFSGANIGSFVFPILIMGTLAERFASVQTEKGTYSAVQLTIEVTFVAVVCYLIVGQWVAFRTLMLATPEIVFIFIGADIMLGRYTGLRITEYVRFKDVLKKAEEE